MLARRDLASIHTPTRRAVAHRLWALGPVICCLVALHGVRPAHAESREASSLLEPEPEPVAAPEPGSEPVAAPDPTSNPEPVAAPPVEPEPLAEPDPEPTETPVDTGIAPASEPTPPPPAPAVLAATPPAPAKPLVTVTGAPGDGATIAVGDVFSLNVRGRIQVRYQLELPDGQDPLQTVNIYTTRLWFSGKLLRPELTYMLQLALAARDFRDNARSPIFDAYLDFKAHRDFSLRVGQFFVPFDRLRTVREWALQLPNRPIPVGELTLDRDVGIVFYSDRFLGDKSPFAYRLGVFGGGGTNLSVGKKPGALVVARLELRPLGPIDDDIEGDLERRKRPGLAIGVGGAGNFNTDRQRSTTGATYPGGEVTYAHAAADLVFKARGFALQGEYLLKLADENTFTYTDEDGMDATGNSRSGQGWVGQASYIFPKPVEIVARMSGLYSIGETDPALRREAENRGQEIVAGLNYYVNGHKFKIQLDWLARTNRDFELRDADHVFHAQLDVTF